MNKLTTWKYINYKSFDTRYTDKLKFNEKNNKRRWDKNV